jgi:hypothetical protein
MRSSPRKATELEKLHQQAQQLLAQKASEIAAMTESIDAAETALSKARAALIARTSQSEGENLDIDIDIETQQDRYQREIEELMAQSEAEVKEIQLAHALRLKELGETFRKSITDGEEWAKIHAAAVKAQKLVELDQSTKQLEEARGSNEDSRLNSTKSRVEVYEQSKGVSIMNEQRINRLENQITEMTAVTREEIRDIKAKIKEVLFSLELRQREHAVDIANLEREAAAQQAKYDIHLRELDNEHASEKLRLEQNIAAETAKIENAHRLIEQIEENQRNCVQRSRQDIERMKATLSHYRAESERGLEQTRSFVSRATSFDRKKRDLDREISMIEQEIAELQEENGELRTELGKLDQIVYRRTV